MIISDYISTRKKLFSIPFIVCITIGGVSIVLSTYEYIDLYSIIVEYNTFICVLLGFTLASFTLFLSNEDKIKELKEFQTKREINGKKISLFKLVCIEFSFLLFVETFVCCSFFISGIFNPLTRTYIPTIIADFFNGIYIIAFFGCFYMTIKTIKNIYLIASKE